MGDGTLAPLTVPRSAVRGAALHAGGAHMLTHWGRFGDDAAAWLEQHGKLEELGAVGRNDVKSGGGGRRCDGWHGAATNGCDGPHIRAIKPLRRWGERGRVVVGEDAGIMLTSTLLVMQYVRRRRRPYQHSCSHSHLLSARTHECHATRAHMPARPPLWPARRCEENGLL